MLVGLRPPAIAADVAVLMPVKAPKRLAYDWTGFYVGAHGNYTTGYSRWSATEAGAAVASVAGSLDFFHAFSITTRCGDCPARSRLPGF
jgi:outer membrane immunogenic protein